MNWIELKWSELSWIELNWIELNWIELSWSEAKSSEANTRLPFTFSRRQFPVKLAYAMTINKSQGQSLTKVGIYLPQCVFSHGQLYVAFSRAQDPENVKTFIIPIENKQGPMPSPLNNTYTSNVVYRNVLLWFDH